MQIRLQFCSYIKNSHFRLDEEVSKLKDFDLVFHIRATSAEEAAELLQQAVFMLARTGKPLCCPLKWASLATAEDEPLLELDKWGARYAPGTFGQS